MTIHDLDFLDHPERTRAEIRRDYPALARVARPAGRPGRRGLAAHGRATSNGGSASTASRISICRPGRPRLARAATPSRRRAACCFSARSSRERISTCCSTRTSGCSRGDRAIDSAARAGRPRDAARPTPSWRARRARPLAGHVELPGYIDPDRRRELYRARARVRAAVAHRRASACRRSKR